MRLWKEFGILYEVKVCESESWRETVMAVFDCVESNTYYLSDTRL